MPDNDVMKLPEWLAEKTWLECKIELCNTWAERGSEHPLFIFDAILKYASHLEQEWPTFLFRPERKFPNVVTKGHHYRFTLVFPECNDETVMKSAIASLQGWLSRDKSHFAIASHGPVILQTGQKIWDAFLRMNPEIANAPGIRLELISPLPYENREHGFKGAIHAEKLADMLLRRVERLFGEMPASLKQAILSTVPELRLLPWYWAYSISQHKAKSRPGVRYLNGFDGPLWLSGPFTRLLPLLVMASHLNLGSRLSAGQGALTVSSARPFLSHSLFDDCFWMRAWEDLAQNEPSLAHDLPEGMFEQLCEKRLETPPDKWQKAGVHLDGLLGLGLFSLLSGPLGRSDENTWKKWLDVLPVLPKDPASLRSILDIIPPGDELLRNVISGFYSLCLIHDEIAKESDAESQDDTLRQFAPLRRPCIISHPGAAVSLAKGRIEARYDSQSLGSVPLGHVSGIEPACFRQVED